MAKLVRNSNANVAVKTTGDLWANNEIDTPAEDVKQQAEVYLNVGYIAKDQDEEGNPSEIFMSLPIVQGQSSGIALDTMQPAVLPSKAGRSRDLAVARNKFLAKLQAKGAELAPGESVVLETVIRVELRRANTKSTEAADGETSAFELVDF